MQYRSYIMLILLCFSYTSCEDLVEVDIPDHKIVSETVFSNNETANSAVLGIYNELSRSAFSSGFVNSITVLAGLSSDNLRSTVSSANRVDFEENEILIQNSNNLGIWSSAYYIVYMCNAVLDGLNTYTGVSETMKQKLIGEVIFVRAFTYFQLVNLYGDLPLILSSDYRNNANRSRNPIDEIYDQIEEDLLRAIELLDTNYENGERLRPNKFTAMALLARVYLYLEDWEKAENWSGQVINGTEHFGILNDLNAVFLANTREAIWQISPKGRGEIGSHTREGNVFILLTNTGNVALSEDLFAAFPDNDLRIQNWIGIYDTENERYYYPFKYKIKNAIGDATEYSMVLRLAEQYLIRAEARTEQGKLPGAIADLDIIRQRSGLEPIAILDPNIAQDELLEAIMKERRRELFTEWGHRWLDLKRTEKATETLGPIKPLWQSTDVNYPIPEEEIRKNPNMTQNQGY